MALGRFSHLSLFIRVAPLCTVSLPCCILFCPRRGPLAIIIYFSFYWPVLLLWPLILSFAAFFGPRLFALLACRAIAFLLLRAAPVRAFGQSCCFHPLCSAWPLAVTLLSRCFFGPGLRALLACNAVYCFVLGVAFGHITLLLLRAAPLYALLASPAAFLPFPRHGLWPLLLSLAASSGRASVCYWPVVLRIALSLAWPLAI